MGTELEAEDDDFLFEDKMAELNKKFTKENELPTKKFEKL